MAKKPKDEVDSTDDAGSGSEALPCPICEHQAARPNDADLARIAEKRGQEKTGFIISLALCLVALAAFFVWVHMLGNPHVNAQENGPGFYGPLAVAILAF